VALVGAYGLDAWRREHVGRRQLDLAEEALALFYEARDAMSYIRSPMSFSHEKLELERGENETDQQYSARLNASVVFYRHSQREELFSRIHALRYQFRAQFGVEKTTPFEEFSEAHRKVLTSARLLSQYWAEDRFGSSQQRDDHFERVRRQETIFWEDDPETDKITKSIESSVQSIENTCCAVIEARGTLYGFLNRKI